jgi:hypothetical protein
MHLLTACILQRLKSALWYAVGQIVDEESLARSRNATPQFIGALTELVWTQIGEPPSPPRAGHEPGATTVSDPFC